MGVLSLCEITLLFSDSWKKIVLFNIEFLMYKTGLIQVATEFFTWVDPGWPNLFLFYQQFSVNVKYRKFLETPISIIIFFSDP